MAPMPCTEYCPAERATLLRIARNAMIEAVHRGQILQVKTDRLPAALSAVRCTFVSLHRAGELRGCTGSLEAEQPLAVDVAEAAYRTTLCDPRFYPVRADEIDDINIEISVLSPLTALPVTREADLLKQLRPGIDGLVLQAGARRATFLPKVWESLDEPRTFIGELKAKAGLPPDYWSPDMRVYRYHTETFAEKSTSQL